MSYNAGVGDLSSMGFLCVHSQPECVDVWVCGAGMEIIGPRYRMATGILVQAWFALGFMLLPPLSYAIRDHIKLQIVCALLPAIMWTFAL